MVLGGVWLGKGLLVAAVSKYVMIAVNRFQIAQRNFSQRSSFRVSPSPAISALGACAWVLRGCRPASAGEAGDRIPEYRTGGDGRGRAVSIPLSARPPAC
jgi:hypothetical protein